MTAAFSPEEKREDGESLSLLPGTPPPGKKTFSSFSFVSATDRQPRRFSGDEAFAGDQRDASRQDAGVELGVVVQGKSKGTKL